MSGKRIGRAEPILFVIALAESEGARTIAYSVHEIVKRQAAQVAL